VPTESASERAIGVQPRRLRKRCNRRVGGSKRAKASAPEVTVDTRQDIDEDDGDMLNARSAIYRAVCLHYTLVSRFQTRQARSKWMRPHKKKMRGMFTRLMQETDALVVEHWRTIRRVAKTLERHDRIDQAELDRLIAVAHRAQT
jgi:hypothetical protein